MREGDENNGRRPVGHWVGEPLDKLSVEELGLRIEFLAAEIARLEAERDVKKAALERAASIFRL